MSDTLKDTRQNAITYVEGRPHLELAADQLTFPIATLDDRFVLYITMRTYHAQEVKRFYDQMIPRRKRRTVAETTVETPDLSLVHEFIMRHFVSFSGAQLEDGTEPSIEQQQEWLRENPSFQERIFREGYDRVGPRFREETPEGPRTSVILVFGQREYRIPLEMTLYSPELNCEEKIRYLAIMEKLTQAEKHQYDKSISVIENSRRGEVYTEANWDVIEHLCNRKIKRLEGDILINGQPCSEENKADWINRLLFIPKIYIMAQTILEVDLKNA